MQLFATIMQRRFGSLLWVLAVFASAAVAQPRIYRCEDGGKVTYADFPCTGAQEVAVNTGQAAPDARERLKRDQDALDVRAAQRRDALARQEAIERMEAQRAAAFSEAPPAAEAPPDYYYPGYLTPLPRHAARSARDAERERQRRREQRRSVIRVPPPPHLPSPPPGPR